MKTATVENMQHRFEFEDVQVCYWLVREPRKSIAATVYPDGSVTLRAPDKAKAERIEAFLKRRWRWIRKQQRYFSQFKAEPAKDYVSGETFRYLGRGYKLLVRKAQNEPRVLLKQGTLTVLSSNPEESQMTRQLLEDWFRKRAEVIFNERLDLCFANFHHRDKPKLVVRRLERWWGSHLKRGSRSHLNLVLTKPNRLPTD